VSIAAGNLDATSVTNEEIRRELWKGVIPIMFNLTPNENITLQPPEPYYILAPRSSYLNLVSSAVNSHFLAVSSVMVDEMWFDFKGKPIKWHYPIGVLFDVLGSSMELPWALTVHFQGFPSDQLLRCPNEATMKSHLTSMLKESTFIKNGDCSKINDLSVSDSNDLWEGFKLNDFDKFWKSNSKLQSEGVSLKRVPIRIFQLGNCTQVPVTALDEKGVPKTLRSALIEIVPHLFSETQTKAPRVIIQGVCPSLDTPITWLSENFAHPDSFLYIVIKS